VSLPHSTSTPHLATAVHFALIYAEYNIEYRHVRDAFKGDGFETVRHIACIHRIRKDIETSMY
jgi:hypothetical protein